MTCFRFYHCQHWWNHWLPKFSRQHANGLFDRAPKSEIAQFDTVLVNNEFGAKLAVEELIRQGASKVGIVVSGVQTSGQERLKGYKQALKEYQVTLY